MVSQGRRSKLASWKHCTYLHPKKGTDPSTYEAKINEILEHIVPYLHPKKGTDPSTYEAK
jgi:hypothetical protein